MTEPIATSHHALAGVYDLTTRLDTFSFETSALSLPDCQSVSYCTHHRAFSGATLLGTLTLTDSANGTQLYFSGEIQGSFCDQWELVAGCTHVAPKALHGLPTMYDPPLQKNMPKDASDSVTQYRVTVATTDRYLPEIVALTYRVAPDSLYGRVYWAQTVGRSPPAHIGTFVARRRR